MFRRLRDRLLKLFYSYGRRAGASVDRGRFRTVDRASYISPRESIAEYWIGRGVDYRGLWEAYDGGTGYIEKYHTMTVHLLVIEFAGPPKSKPLFEHEAVFKTIKGYFHDFKQACLSPHDYAQAGPLFFYSTERGSGIYKFLGELRQLITFGSTLADEKAMGRHLDNLDQRLAFLKKHFGPIVDEEAFRAFMRARTTEALDEAIERLFRCGIKSVKISKEPFRGRIEEAERSLIEVKETPPPAAP